MHYGYLLNVFPLIMFSRESSKLFFGVPNCSEEHPQIINQTVDGRKDEKNASLLEIIASVLSLLLSSVDVLSCNGFCF